MNLNEECLSKLANVANVDLNAVATTNLYTVPTGKKLVVSHVVIRDLSASAAGGPCALTLGQTAAKTDFLNTQTLTNLNAAAKAAVLQPIPNATPAALEEYTAGEIFCADITVAAGVACTATLDVYGTLADA